jgi:hypothetical protein
MPKCKNNKKAASTIARELKNLPDTVGDRPTVSNFPSEGACFPNRRQSPYKVVIVLII